MSKRGSARVRKALAWGNAQGFGPLLNARHPKKVKRAASEKKTAASSAKADGGKAEQTLRGTVSASNDNKGMEETQV